MSINSAPQSWKHLNQEYILGSLIEIQKKLWPLSAYYMYTHFVTCKLRLLCAVIDYQIGKQVGEKNKGQDYEEKVTSTSIFLKISEARHLLINIWVTQEPSLVCFLTDWFKKLIYSRGVKSAAGPLLYKFEFQFAYNFYTFWFTHFHPDRDQKKQSCSEEVLFFNEYLVMHRVKE